MARKPEGPDPPSATDTGMDKQAMKKMLVRARKAPVNCAMAVGDTESGGSGLLLMDKRKPARSLLKTLKEQFPTAKNPSFGTASVDPAADPFMVQFKMNKTYGGFDRKIVKLLRGTGFKKVAVEKGGGEEDEDEG